MNCPVTEYIEAWGAKIPLLDVPQICNIGIVGTLLLRQIRHPKKGGARC